MTVVCLGWGSLCWNPGELPIQGGWEPDGPSLPLEFARQSSDGRLTLVIVENSVPVSVKWARLSVNSLDEAIAVLQKREGVPYTLSIGRWPNQTTKDYPYKNAIEIWAKQRGISGVVWTALLAGMKNNRGHPPSLDELLTYLSGLGGATRQIVAEYIRKAPDQIQTPYRLALEAWLRRLEVHLP